MSKQERRDDGRFAAKSDEIRQVRSIRLTDRAWDYLGKLAELRSITRADLLEELTENGFFNKLPELSSEHSLEKEKHQEEIEALKQQIDNLTQENQLLSKRVFTELAALRDAVLFSLKMGKQAPGYKAAQKALDRFIEELMK